MRKWKILTFIINYHRSVYKAASLSIAIANPTLIVDEMRVEFPITAHILVKCEEHKICYSID
jgi:hypothetical protein